MVAHGAGPLWWRLACAPGLRQAVPADVKSWMCVRPQHKRGPVHGRSPFILESMPATALTHRVRVQLLVSRHAATSGCHGHA